MISILGLLKTRPKSVIDYKVQFDKHKLNILIESLKEDGSYLEDLSYFKMALEEILVDLKGSLYLIGKKLIIEVEIYE